MASAIKTESRREILKKLPGSCCTVRKKAESERKLEAANANMDRVQDIIGEIGKAGSNGLKEDSIKAKEYLKLRDRYKELEIDVVLKNVENLKAKSEGIHEDLKQLDESLAKTRGERSAAEQSAASMRNARKHWNP